MKRINVTKTFLPPIEEYQAYLEEIWDRDQLTNQGPILKEFEKKLETYLGVSNFHFLTNGTLALQVALRSLGITEGEVITTPFSYVATTSSILWERCTPVFVDIDPKNLCIDADKIEVAITSKTKAILPVHVFGNPCDVEKIDAIAKKHKLRVLYDAAHAFAVQYKNKSILNYGDISMCSFHSTKLFHTIEGGGLVIRDEGKSRKVVELIKRFGHEGDEHYRLGINAKASEFQAAMGLCNLKYVDQIIEERKKISHLYDRGLKGKFKRPTISIDTKYNYAYYPVIFNNEKAMLKKLDKLKEKNIHPRRYFYPSLNTLPYIKNAQKCPISEDISRRVVCLPLYSGLEEEVVNKICEVISR
jgi:dTDP-4-amino-4,6-dideoxygalactose transaminase